MAYKKSFENPKPSSHVQTRKTMLFNERTDRSLNAELSQLELCRKEVKRDLRKIHQIREALNENFLSALERRQRNRSVSDTNLKDTNMFPQIAGVNNHRKNFEKRRRFNSDPASFTSSHNTQALNEPLQSFNSTEGINFGETGLDNINEGTQNFGQYITNQQRREELMIKSRFNQLGSKFVGVEMMTKRKKSLSRMTDRNGNFSDTISDKKNRLKINNRKLIENQDEISSELGKEEMKEQGLSSDFANLNVSTGENSTPNKPQMEIKRLKFFSGIPVVEEPLATISTKENFNNRQPLKQQIKGSSVSVGGGTLQRKISTGSMSGNDSDARQRPEVPLPRIPLELTSSRISKNGAIVEQAFITCQQLNSDNKDEKKERKRRFASLVDAVIKQGKVIKAWEPLLSKFGDIHSSDDES